MEKQRLQKIIADSGMMSRRAAEEEIKAGNVSVNGHKASLGDKAGHNDLITVKGQRVNTKKREYVYVMLNKPRGYVCSTSDERGRKCVTELIEGVDARIYPVGRLDMLSEGMLLLTDDGDLKNKLTHPSTSLPKLYRVKVAGSVNSEQYEILTSEMTIDDYKIKPVDVQIAEEDESGTVLKMTLLEGRNRQIRKMCEQVGLDVKRLSRISIGNLKLDGLSVGKWRFLTEKEIAYLKASTRKK